MKNLIRLAIFAVCIVGVGTLYAQPLPVCIFDISATHWECEPVTAASSSSITFAVVRRIYESGSVIAQGGMTGMGFSMQADQVGPGAPYGGGGNGLAGMGAHSSRTTQSLTGFTLPTTVSSGATFTGVVTGTPGAEIDITSPTNLIDTPDDCWVLPTVKPEPACQFKAPTVTSAKSVTITAKLGKVSFARTVTVEPGTVVPPVLSILFCAEPTLTGPGTMACDVELSGPATVLTTIPLSSSSGSLIVPASVQVPAGTSIAGFTVTAAAVTVATPVTITASLAGNTANTTLTLEPATVTPPPVTLKALSCAQASITGAGMDSCTVTLSAASTAPQTVTLSSSNASLTVPASVTVAAGSTSAPFTATSLGVTAASSATLTGKLGTSTATFIVTLNPVATVAYKVSLTWAAPVASPVAVTGYRVYRGGVLLAAVTTLAYVDLTPVDGATYAYTVTSVSVTGAESTPSNVFSAVIP